MVSMDTHSSSSIVWLVHLVKSCPQQVRWLYEKKAKTFPVDPYDSRAYETALVQLQIFFTTTGWTVASHRPITARFGNVYIGHYFDLFLSKDSQNIVIIIKPEDRAYYTELYNFSLLLLRYANISATLLLYESNTHHFIPKRLDSYVFSEQMFQSKIHNFFAPHPSKTKTKNCSYCPFSECEYHPVNDKQCSIIEQIIQELEELVQ